MIRLALEAKLGVDATNGHYELASAARQGTSQVQAAAATAGVAASGTSEQQSAPRSVQPEDDEGGVYL